jgi:hypothetical protein
MEEMDWEESVKGIKNLFKPPSSIQKEEEDQAKEADIGEEKAWELVDGNSRPPPSPGLPARSGSPTPP